jgi:septum formation protein
MLKKFTNREHLVITGVVGLKNDVSFVDYDITRVRFKNVEEAVIKRYVETDEGLDKAGGYAIQGLGAMLIDKVDGSVDNVIGIPLLKVIKILRTIGEV